MIDVSLLPVFSLAVLALAITPGQDLALIIARGIGQGKRVACYTVLGFALAGLVQIPAAAFGLAALLEERPGAFQAVKIAGALYLIYLGLSTFHTARAMVWSSGDTSTLGRHAVREGFIASLLNPKAILFIFAFLPQFVDTDNGDFYAQVLMLGLLMKLIVFCVETGVAVASGSVRDWFAADAARQTKLQYLTACVLCLLGMSIFFTA